jgi:hypothetical protein
MTQPFALNVPLGSVSFGQTSVAILRELFKRGLSPSVFPIGPVDLSTQKADPDFNAKLQQAINSAQQRHSRQHTSFRLWHIPGSLETVSARDSRLITFQETGQLTSMEINILRQQQKVYVTNRYAQTFFKLYGVEAEYLPLGFDAHNFGVLAQRPRIEGVTSWLLTSKLESRKWTLRQLALWCKRYGRDKNHRLNLSIHNPFLRPEDQQAMIHQALKGKTIGPNGFYWNVNPLGFAPTNADYNAVLQSSEIVLCCSGSEGFGLPEFHATALGAWPVALKAHAYLDYFTDENACWVQPNGMEPIYDGIFFHQGQPVNQGNRFTFADEDFYAACAAAEERAKTGLNVKGLELQKQTYAQTVDILLKDL